MNLRLLFILPHFASSLANEANGGDLIAAHKYFANTYSPIIQSLRRGERVKRSDIISAYKGDPFLRDESKGGHATFKHKILPLTFGLQAHDSKDIKGQDERVGHHKSLQVYINIIKCVCGDLCISL